MRTAVDTNVLLDLLGGDSAASDATSNLAAATAAGTASICPVVYAELAASFEHQHDLDNFLGDLDIRVEPFSADALREAATAWKSYTRRRGQAIQCPRCNHSFALPCPACGNAVSWRQHILSDFLIGGHAVAHADQLLTRDFGYYRTYFPDLSLVGAAPEPPLR